MKVRKTRTKTVTRGFAAMLGIGFGLCISTHIALADDRIDPEELTAQWWQWAISIPTAQNPIFDPTGGNCMIGQRGPIWFLAGNFGGTNTRNCSVPAGTTLFFPIVNSLNFNSPDTCGQNSQNLSVKDLRAGSAAFINTVTDLRVDLDSMPIHNFQRVQSDVFAVVLPADNIFKLFTPACAPGVYSPSIDDGYYVKLAPLGVGNHTLHMRAAAPGTPPFSLDVTYRLTVVRVVDK